MSDTDGGYSDLIGQELGGFRLTRRVGEGGMAVVFEGENTLDPSIRRAIKVIRTELASRQDFVARFVEEARTLERINHDNIVRFFGVRRERGYLFMELELLSGKELCDAVPASGKLDPVEAIVAMAAACDGVGAAHAGGIVHRDLKPENLFITRDRVIKVLDFGLARALDETDRASKLTRVGTVPGTPAYMAPEVCNGGVPTYQADVYALGMTLYELVAGHHPFRPPGQPLPNSAQLMMAQMTREIPPLGSVVPGLPDGLDAVVTRSLAKDPAQRFANGQEMANALHALRVTVAASNDTHNRTRLELPSFRMGTPTPLESASMPGAPASGAGFSSTVGGTVTTTESGMALVEKPAAPMSGKTKGGIALGVLVSLAGVAWVGKNYADKQAELEAQAAAQAAEEQARAEAAAHLALNPWVRVDPYEPKPREPALLLGLPSRGATSSDSGFSASRKISPPTAAFEMQRHEVSWAEFEGWYQDHVASKGEAAADRALLPVPWQDGLSPDARAEFPVVGVPWQTAVDYCSWMGGLLPTEEQYEWAARGPELRPHPWGETPLDRTLTAAYRGEGGQPNKVASSLQDRTEADQEGQIFDLGGNAMEWTLDLYREPKPGADESWVQGANTFRTVRGLPLHGSLPSSLPRYSATSRQLLCADGGCLDSDLVRTVMGSVGFRCVRPVVED